MVSIDQGTWNLLFGWIAGRQCMLPEGCGMPAAGVILYVLMVAAIAVAAHYLYRGDDPWRR